MPGKLIADPDMELELEGDGLDSALVVDAGSGDKTTTKVDDLTVTPSEMDGDDVPEKYRGKTARELLDIVTNQESLMGRHSTELGTLRGLVDQSLRLRDTGDVGRQEPKVEPLTEEDFLTHPEDATRRTVQDETAELRDQVASLSAQAQGHQFDVRYPDAAKDINDEQFVEFIKGTPLRHRLATSAFGDSKNLDFEAAGELWALYEDHKALQPAPTQTEEEKLASEGNKDDASESKAKARKVPDLVSGPTTSTSVKDKATNKRIYSQAALNRLQEKDPDLYWSTDIQTQISAAHQEGRVRQDL